ncbi:hypothetical protein Aab01nite_60860 [Paractinoplanes abujensis]|uniref:Uncharacterized protein n=1 Tax=Paractinoplanes abujensis TaxID=882441 RepID=A0A7W7CQS6_9ACTN|nr:hypothetical protein [Actinoplanes abujensis]MBB4693000.1 hypothetical protein [Actinoplanes abujensis]GID22496.1 hypothetical protein Aab01nite_60860 [Actinoplanes abujensis]
MDDLEQRLARSMHGAAAGAPPDAQLLSKVHQRSGRYRRRRLAVQVSALAAVLAVGVPAVAVLLDRPGPSVPLPAATGVTPSLTLVPGFQNPVFPYALPPTDGMRAPVATLRSGTLSAFFEATDLRDHADTTVTVTGAKPSFTDGTTVTVRGRTGWLRTIAAEPARQYVLYWPERAGQWLQLATDDTYTPAQVIALAESLTSGAIAVLPPFRLDWSPAGLTPDTVTESTMSFGDGAFSVVLRKEYPLPADGRRLTRDADGARLEVAVADWDAVLDITAGSALTVSDADLLRFAAGVHILNRSNPR